MNRTTKEINAAILMDVSSVYDSLKVNSDARDCARLLIRQILFSNFSNDAMKCLDLLGYNPALLKLSQKETIAEQYGQISDSEILLLSELTSTERLVVNSYNGSPDYKLHCSLNNIPVTLDLLEQTATIETKSNTIELSQAGESSILNHSISQLCLAMDEQALLEPVFENIVHSGLLNGIELLTHQLNPVPAKNLCKILIDDFDRVNTYLWVSDVANRHLLDSRAFKNGLIEIMNDCNLERHYENACNIFESMTDPQAVIDATWQHIVGQPAADIQQSCIWPLVSIESLQSCRDSFSDQLVYGELLSSKLSTSLANCAYADRPHPAEGDIDYSATPSNSL